MTDKTCLKCGQCCHATTVSITDEEVDKIANIIGFHKFYRIRCTGAKVLNWQKDGKHSCFFFNKKTHRCKIYKNRPLVCQEFFCNKCK